MKILATLLFTSICFITSAQVNLEKNVETSDDSRSIETFYVLSENQNIRQGDYAKTSTNGRVLVKGQYENNTKVGAWEFYDYRGNIDQKYNYSTSQIEYEKEPMWSNSSFLVLIDGEYIKVELDSKPILIGGQFNYNYSINYPVDARRNGIQGTALISIDISSTGQQSNERIVSHVGGGCDEEALRVIKLIQNDWVPATMNNKPVAVRFSIPIEYKLR